jgi:hypothetical protein
MSSAGVLAWSMMFALRQCPMKFKLPGCLSKLAYPTGLDWSLGPKLAKSPRKSENAMQVLHLKENTRRYLVGR